MAVLNTRIIQKHDTAANWNLNPNFKPNIGEIIIYDPDEEYIYSRLKIGDGIRVVSELPFVGSILQTYLMQQIGLVDNKVENVIAQLTIDYDANLAFDTTEIVFNSNASNILGQAILGQLILG